MKGTSVQRKLRELADILDTLELIKNRATGPRSILAGFYALVLSALAFLAVPSCLGLVCTIGLGISMRQFLKKFGPGRASWWACLSDQLWSYEPIDIEALTSLREDLVENSRQGQRYALSRVIDWSRAELAAISAKARGI